MRSSSLRLRAISPVIAMVIIVAITLSIAFAVVGWLFGLWGGLAGGTPQISITNLKVSHNEAKGYTLVEFYVVNEGAGSDKILKVELIKGEKIATNTTSIVIEANVRRWITYNVTGLTLNPGDSVLVKVYLEKSGVYSLPAVVSPGGELAGGTPQISITDIRVYNKVTPVTYSGIYYEEEETVIEFYVVNEGAGSDKILKVELLKEDKEDKAYVFFTTTLVAAYERKWVTVSARKSLILSQLSDFHFLKPGDRVRVKVYFEKSGVYSLNAVVSSPG